MLGKPLSAGGAHGLLEQTVTGSESPHVLLEALGTFQAVTLYDRLSPMTYNPTAFTLQNTQEKKRNDTISPW